MTMMIIRYCEWLIIIIAVLSFLTTSTRRRDRIYCTAAAAAPPPPFSGGNNNNNNKDPYAVLGVSSSASQDEIRRRYRELCLRYHPDKNVHLSTERERQECLEAFKDVQRANDEIGTAQSRRAHDDAARRRRAASYFGGGNGRPQRPSSPSSFYGSSGTTGTPSTTGADHPTSGGFDDLFRAFGSFANSSPSFVFHRGDGFPTTTATPESPSSYNNNAGSLFVQTVKVPLRDLYAGKRSMLFRRRKNNPFDRYAAAFRGGAAYVVLYQSILFSIPLLQIVGRWASLAFGLLMFDHNLPRPNACNLYRADLKAGYKGGTKLKFRDGLDPRVEVSFVIEEEKHERYERIGDDLHATATISPEEAKSGCSFRIDPLDPSEEPVEVKVPPARTTTTTTTTNNGSEQQQQEHTTITVKGRGWPIRRTKNNRKGDLIVHIRVEKRSRRRRGRRRSGRTTTTTTTAGE